MSKDISLKKIGCSNCGAELLFDPGTQMSNCNFCGSSFEITNANDEVIIVPDGILPFSVTIDEYNKKVLEWLSEGDYTPDDILGGSQFSSSNGLYLPMFFFTGKYSGNWSASSGYERREYYTEWSETQKKYVEKSRIVTDWRPSSGSVAGSYSILSYAGNSENIDESVAVYAHGTSFKRGEMKPYDIKFTQGFSLLEYKKDEYEAWDKYGFSQLELITKLDAKKRVPGDKHKDFYCDVSKSDDNFIRVYVPFWITYYNYKNKKYHVHMDGSSISRIEGNKPVDEDRKKEVNKKFIKGHVALAVSVIAFCFVVFGDLSENEQSEYWPFIIGLFTISLVLYGIGSYQKNKIISESKQRRKEILKRIQEGKGMIPVGSTSSNNDNNNDSPLEIQKEKENNASIKKGSSFSKKYLWILILPVILVLAFLFSEELGITKNNISSQNEDLKGHTIEDTNYKFSGKDFYIIAVDVASSDDEAQKKVSKLISQGHNSDFLWIPQYPSLSGKNFYSVFIGPFFNLDDCAIAVEKYRKVNSSAYGLLVSSKSSDRIEIRGRGRIKASSNNTYDELNFSSTYIKSQRAYFHSSPNLESRLKSYVIIGDKIEYDKESLVNGFYNCKFINNSGSTTSGWIRQHAIFPEKKTLLDIITDNNYESLGSINRDQFNVFPQDFSIKIKDGKTRINVRDTYDIANSQVITQVSENESYSVVEIALVNSNLLTLKNDFITKPIAVNGSLTNNSSNFTFSKGLKLDNIYENNERSVVEDSSFSNTYLADLVINVGKADQTTYTVIVPKELVLLSANTIWYKLYEKNGWILSDFCSISTDKSKFNDNYFENEIQSLLKAEDNRDFNSIISHYDVVEIKRYWEIYNPSYIDLEKEYTKSWGITSSSINKINNISRQSEYVYDVEIAFEYFHNKDNKWKTVVSNVRFVFGSRGKIIEVYGL